MKKEEEKSYEIAVAKDLSTGVVGPSPSGGAPTPMHNDASYRYSYNHLSLFIPVKSRLLSIIAYPDTIRSCYLRALSISIIVMSIS